MSARPVGQWLLVLAGLVVVATVVGAIAVMGSPGEQRQMRIDEQRVQDLRSIEAAVRLYRNDEGSLPDDLATIDARPGVALDLADPQTGAPYEYRRTGADAFELCASFATDSATRKARRNWQGIEWAHGTGRHCFTFRIEDKDRATADSTAP
ncbi:hypothetical protein ACFONC_05990 [Luteimonas soli]|uniref:Type II secretion system protein n=1 Tax=Luteimonas soli TaxID=1648966 RepID=A0ABV7XI22_9GAMM